MTEILKRIKLFAGHSIETLAANIANKLDYPLSNVDISQFNDGETNIEINEHIGGYHVFIIQSTCTPVNDNLMDFLIMVDACKRSDAKSITGVIPYYGYSRQDRRPGFTRTPITSKLVADMMQVAGVTRLVTVDIHSQQQKGFFNIPVHNISAAPEIIADIWKKYQYLKLKIISPDVGGVGRARSIAKQLNVDLAVIDKRRPEVNKSEVMNIIGNVNGFHCVIIDDLIDTAGTLCKTARALKEHGAYSVTAYATHPVFSGEAIKNIYSSELDEVVITDTIPLYKHCPKIRQLSMTDLLAETIRRLCLKQSISDVYMEC